VYEALECDLLPSLEDPALANLHVVSVELKNMACIRVTVAPATASTAFTASEIEARLSHAESRLRQELASILRLKRMPLLRLSYLPLPMFQEGGAHEDHQ
jgi:ribosome-binding factor A